MYVCGIMLTPSKIINLYVDICAVDTYCALLMLEWLDLG